MYGFCANVTLVWVQKAFSNIQKPSQNINSASQNVKYSHFQKILAAAKTNILSYNDRILNFASSFPGNGHLRTRFHEDSTQLPYIITPFVGGIEPVANKNPPNGSQRKDSVRELPTMALKVTPKC